MSKKPKPSKPAGTTGHLPWGSGGGAFRRLPLPPDGRERERFVIEALFRDQHHEGPDLKALFGTTRDPQQNPDENEYPDFFLLESALGLRDLELTEFAPLRHFGTYQDVPHAYERGSLADLVVAAIMRKWGRYREAARGAALLVYSADWRLHLDAIDVELVRRALSREDQGFALVLYYALHDDLGGQLHQISPSPTGETFPRLDEATERKRTPARADLTGG